MGKEGAKAPYPFVGKKIYPECGIFLVQILLNIIIR
jgi:hypothetical protein